MPRISGIEDYIPKREPKDAKIIGNFIEKDVEG